MSRRTTKDEQEIAARFSERYAVRSDRVLRGIERNAIGANVGANGYTTIAQANVLIARLALRPGQRLLDLGAGRGWPGLYIARRTRCNVVLADLPKPALRSARERALQDGIGDRAECVVSSAVYLPFRRSSFDAVVHTDVLC